MKPYSEIAELLKNKDKKLEKAILSVEEELHPTPSIDIYFYLLRSIVSQQLSVKVAAVIWKRFLELFPDDYPTEKLVLDKSDEELRAIGLSRQKLSYIKNVATFSLEHGMSFEILSDKSDEEIIKYLTAIKGVGKWTVQMVLMFPLDRPDVFPIDDLGIQVKIMHYYGLEGDRKSLRKEMIEIADVWKPYRSLACKYLWKSVS